jgi:anti-sigma B factor antagonist
LKVPHLSLLCASEKGCKRQEVRVTGETGGLPVIVMLPDEIDFTNATAATAALFAAADNPGMVIADMSGTDFCDSSGMRMLLVARTRAKTSGATLRVVIRPGSPVARAAAILGLDQMLPVYASVPEAVSSQGDPSQPTP